MHDANTPWGAILLALADNRIVHINYNKEEKVYVISLEYRSGKWDAVAIPFSATDEQIAKKINSIVGLREIE
jgi:hypothetical protein